MFAVGEEEGAVGEELAALQLFEGAAQLGDRSGRSRQDRISLKVSQYREA